MRLFVKAEPSTVKHRRHHETLAPGSPLMLMQTKNYGE
jgi:hypothetical protein